MEPVPASDAPGDRVAPGARETFGEAEALETSRADRRSPDAPPQAVQDWLDAASTALAEGTLERLVLSTRRAGPPTLREWRLRRVDVAGQRRVALVERHARRDDTRHLAPADALAAVASALGRGGAVRFGQATLLLADGTRRQLRVNRAGDRAQGSHDRLPGAEWGAAWQDDAPAAEPPGIGADAGAGGTPPVRAPSPFAHDRTRARRLPLDAPFLRPLGLVDAAGRVVPAMARKWRQVDKFLEIVDAALDDAQVEPGARLRVADFGSGKGYLTFAVHAHLRARLGVAPVVTGHELRADLVVFCNSVARATRADGLSFVQGDLAHAEARAADGPLDLLIALHACDTATDEALALGVRRGARMLICAPCCHRELRPRLALPPALRPLLRHGIHLGREAEMVTDALRALALEGVGYDAKVFEFVSLEHTAQNKMIVGVRRGEADPRPAARADDEARALKSFYGLREQALERLLAAGAGAGVRTDSPRS